MNNHILMLCHDQHLDRRVITQGRSLTQLGYKVTLLCLSHNSNDDDEYLPEGIHLIRIGLKHIIPGNKIYKNYMIRKKKIKSFINTAI